MAAGADAAESSERWSDSALLKGLANHEQPALRALIDAYGKFVYGAALQIVREPDLAEEIAEDALLVLWWQPEHFDAAKGSLRSSLIGTARHKSRDVVPHEQVIRAKYSLAGETAALIEAPFDSRVDDGLIVRGAIAKLSRLQREVLFLAYFRGLTYCQIAESLDIPEGTAKTRIRDALMSLRVALGKRKERLTRDYSGSSPRPPPRVAHRTEGGLW